MTNRRTPASTIASVQGPVRPVVEHGSSVTYKVALFGIGLLNCAGIRFRRAGGPRVGDGPFATIFRSITRTAPTAGLGLVCPRALRASRRAARMKKSSLRARGRHAQRYLAWRVQANRVLLPGRVSEILIAIVCRSSRSSGSSESGTISSVHQRWLRSEKLSKAMYIRHLYSYLFAISKVAFLSLSEDQLLNQTD